MRALLIMIVAIGALASIALCGGYGWDQATELKDRITQAFIYGFVSLATLTLHVAAIRIWVGGWRKSGGFVGIIAMLAFVMTAFTSLGGLATRADKVVADRQEAIDTRTDTKKQIADLEAEKAGMKFTRATQATVDAAQRAVTAAEQARDQECTKLGENCRKRQDAVGTFLTALGTAQVNKANTDRFDQIVRDLKALRDTGKTSGTGSADPMNALLGKVMGAYAEVLTSWQKVIFAVVYDLCLVALMISIEAMGHVTQAKRRQPEIVEMEPIIETPAPVQNLPKPRRPRLVATTAKPTGNVPAIVAIIMEPGAGRTSIVDLFKSYRVECANQGKEPADLAAFVLAVKALCKQAGIKIVAEGQHAYLSGVKIKEKRVLTQKEVD